MNKLSIHALTHVPFEGLGCIEQWINNNNHTLTHTRLFDNKHLPEVDEFDWLIIMGGPMGVYDEVEYPWLVEEKIFIRKAIDAGKTLIGICLGSQLIAGVLGARVYPNNKKEIGWFDVKLSETALQHSLFENFEEQFQVFHWHGDTFDIPFGGESLLSSDICINQAFLLDEKVLGLQFHLEVTEESLKEMVENGIGELTESPTIQPAESILKNSGLITDNNLKMFRILDYFEERTSFKV